MVKTKEMQAVKDYATINNAIKLLKETNCCQTSKLYSKKLVIINKLSLLADELYNRFEVEF